jgi:hypothetical protein
MSVIPNKLYYKLCYCKDCNKQFLTLFEYGLHVCKTHYKISFETMSIKGFKKFIENEILKQLNSIEYYNELSSSDKKKVFSIVKKELKNETSFPLSLLIPDGRKKRSKSKKKRKSKSKKRI